MPSERILFVDDDPVARRAFARAMRLRGFVVDLASNGEEAWDLATHFPYAVVATDLRMPGMDGLMLIEQIREVQEDTVCLLVTGCSQVATREEAEEADVDVVFKPWRTEQLALALRQGIDEFRRRGADALVSDCPPAINDGVAVIGLAPVRQEALRLLLSPYYDVHAFADVGAAVAANDAPLVCGFLPDDSRVRQRLQELGDTRPDLGLVVLGDAEAQDRASRALRYGAHDWLAFERLSAPELRRVIELVATRVASLSAPLSTPRLNASSVRAHLNQAVARALRNGRGAGLLRVDLDDFGHVNAALGEDSSDEVANMVANRLRGAVREGDTVLRFRDDAFVLILEDVDPEPSIEVTAQRVVNAFATPFTCRRADVMLSASVGCAVFPRQGQEASSLLDVASDAVAQAKLKGSNRYCVHAGADVTLAS